MILKVVKARAIAAATIKAHVRRFVNEGHDVQTPKDLETAMLSAEGSPKYLG